MKFLSRLIASSQSATAEGRVRSLIKQAARLEKPRGSAGGALGHFRVGFHSGWPVQFFEFLVSELAGFFGFLRVDVGVTFRGDFGLFGGAELGEDFGGAVLG